MQKDSAFVQGRWGVVLVFGLLFIIQGQAADCVPAPRGLVGWWKAESNALDTISGAFLASTTGLGYAEGKVGRAFVFSASGNAVYADASTNLNGASFTWEAGINPSSSNVAQPLFEYASSSSIGTLLWLNMDCSGNIYQPSPGCLMANLTDIYGSVHIICTPPGLVTAGQWNHVALTYDQGSGLAKIYVNGVLRASEAVWGF